MEDTDEKCLSDFKKVQQKCETDGFAEGLSDGHDSVYQQGFDAGYKEAFRFAFELGQQKAVKGTSTAASKGKCVICASPEEIKKELDEVVRNQKLAHSKENFID